MSAHIAFCRCTMTCAIEFALPFRAQWKCHIYFSTQPNTNLNLLELILNHARLGGDRSQYTGHLIFLREPGEELHTRRLEAQQIVEHFLVGPQQTFRYLPKIFPFLFCDRHLVKNQGKQSICE